MSLLLAALLARAGPASAFEVPGFELVYSYPVETTLEEPDLRGAQEVWPQMFDEAKKTIDIEQFYIATAAGEPLEAALAALRRAGERGVKIRFLLEKKFEKNSLDGIAILRTIPHLELRVIDWSKVAGRGIVHAKFFVVDSRQAYIGSQNFDWRSLKHIHELGLRVSKPAVVAGAQAIFRHDWSAAAAKKSSPAQRKRPEPDRSKSAYLLASPWAFNPRGVGDAEAELVRVIGAARQSLLVQLLDYNPTSFARPKRYYAPIDAALRDAAVRGVKVRLLVSHWNTDEPGIDHLKSLALLPGIEIRVAEIPPAASGPIPFSRVIHSKYMVADGSTLWLGTSNWAGGYLDDSRNLELVVKDAALAGRAAAVHGRVWDSAYAAPLDLLKAYAKPRR